MGQIAEVATTRWTAHLGVRAMNHHPRDGRAIGTKFGTTAGQIWWDDMARPCLKARMALEDWMHREMRSKGTIYGSLLKMEMRRVLRLYLAV